MLDMRTKIVATIGPASKDKETIKAMATHGVRVFRLNFSHGDAKSFEPIIRSIREVEQEFDHPLTIMGDLCGPKTRIGEIENSPLTIHQDEHSFLGLPEMRSESGDGVFIPLDVPELLEDLEPGMQVSLSDGLLQYEVVRVLKVNKLYELRALAGGPLTSRKGIAFPGKLHRLPALTDKDRIDLKEGVDAGIDALAISFVQGPEDIEDALRELKRHGKAVPLVAKLERRNAVDTLSDILHLADAVMVARGDLGLECPLSEVPVIQKRIIRAARHAQKASIVATQMLLSMVRNPIPTRAEATDVANAILDGADCVMLSEETAAGEHPVAAVKFIDEVAKHAEEYFRERLKQPYFPAEESSPAKYLAYSAALIAQNSGARAIASHSQLGTTARLISSRRPAHMIYAVTPDQTVARYLNYFWGIRPVHIPGNGRDHVERVEDFIQASTDFRPGDKIIITSGQPTPGQKSTSTNEIKIYTK